MRVKERLSRSRAERETETRSRSPLSLGVFIIFEEIMCARLTCSYNIQHMVIITYYSAPGRIIGHDPFSRPDNVFSIILLTSRCC